MKTNKDRLEEKVREEISRPEEFVDNPSYYSIFSKHEKSIEGKLIDGTQIFTLFGNFTLDATLATVTEDTLIDITCMFGEVEINLPPQVDVEIKGSPLFGELKNKRREVTIAANSPKVTIRILCLFAEVKIR